MSSTLIDASLSPGYRRARKISAQYEFSKQKNVKLLQVLRKLKEANDAEIETIAQLDEPARSARLEALFNQLVEVAPNEAGLSITADRDVRYFELMAEQYALSDTSVIELEDAFFELRNSKFFPAVFAVCLYRWLFEFSSTQLNRNINHFLKGVNRLFWTDVHHDNYHYAAIFNYLVDEIMQNPFQRSCQTFCFTYFFVDLFNLVARFYFYYRPNVDPRLFLDVMHKQVLAQEPRSTPTLSLSAIVRSASQEMLASFTGMASDEEETEDNDGTLGEIVVTNDVVATVLDFDDSPTPSTASSSPLSRRSTKRPASNFLLRTTESIASRKPQPIVRRHPSFGAAISSLSSGESYDEFDEKYERERIEVLLERGVLEDIFVEAVVRTLSAIRNEAVLVSYLVSCQLLKGIDITLATSLRLETALYNYTTPGSPLYPPRSVRNAAAASISFLYPHGSFWRFVVFAFFRMLHPVYTFHSIVFWTREELRVFRMLGVGTYVYELWHHRLLPLWHAWRGAD